MPATVGTGTTYKDIDTTTGEDVQKKAIQTTNGTSADNGLLVAAGPTGQIDVSFMPAGIGPVIVSAKAAATVNANTLVNLVLSGGFFEMQHADASNNRSAWGFCPSGAAAGASANVYLDDLMSGLSGMTIGPAFLGTAGQVVAVPATTSGYTLQLVGFCYSTTQLAFKRHMPTKLA